MVGWFDAVEKGDALRHCGFDDFVINKIDVLTHAEGWQGDLKLCVAYRKPDGGCGVEWIWICGKKFEGEFFGYVDWFYIHYRRKIRLGRTMHISPNCVKVTG